jgi:hypothetical protein
MGTCVGAHDTPTPNADVRAETRPPGAFDDRIITSNTSAALGSGGLTRVEYLSSPDLFRTRVPHFQIRSCP